MLERKCSSFIVFRFEPYHFTFCYHISMFEMGDGESLRPRLVARIGLDFVFGIGEEMKMIRWESWLAFGAVNYPGVYKRYCLG